jgi:hypothetical protein
MVNDLNSRTCAFLLSFGITDKELTTRSIQEFKVGIVADPKILESYSGQLILLALANILPRMWPSISFPACEPTKRIVKTPLGTAPDIGGALSETANIAANALRYELTSSTSPDFVIAIGPTIEPADVYVNADGWVAHISNQSNDVRFYSSSENPFGPIAAACFGAAEAFRAFLRKLNSPDPITHRPIIPYRYSVLRGSESHTTNINAPLPSKIDFGEFTLVGAGAVGSSLIYTLATMRELSGEIHIIDDETIEGSNLNRYLLAGLADIGVAKPTLAVRFLKNNIRVEPFLGSYESYDKRNHIPLLISTVDNRNQNATRRAIQSDLPRLILHAATGEAKVSIARLDFSSGACLGCLFPEEANPLLGEITRLLDISTGQAEQLLIGDQPFSEDHARYLSARTGISVNSLTEYVGKPFMKVFQSMCGNLSVQVEGKRIEAAVPFVSLMAGMMVTAELVKESCSELHGYRLSNYRQMSLFGLGNEWLIFREKGSTYSCYCQENILQKRFKSKWGL